GIWMTSTEVLWAPTVATADAHSFGERKSWENCLPIIAVVPFLSYSVHYMHGLTNVHSMLKRSYPVFPLLQNGSSERRTSLPVTLSLLKFKP
ncbi:uncharacterized protein B0H18DRAFT_1015474, partial [Fomitopsis serialis]|uniref:uncharacterized protein n=1 Tax=Fomitopsis serialis TaxID=139415 RepID=UPI0020089C0D